MFNVRTKYLFKLQFCRVKYLISPNYYIQLKLVLVLSKCLHNN